MKIVENKRHKTLTKRKNKKIKRFLASLDRQVCQNLYNYNSIIETCVQ